MKKPGIFSVAVLLVIAFTAAAYGLSRSDTLRAYFQNASSSTETIDYNGQSIPVNESVQKNEYDTSLFTTDENGLKHYQSDSCTSLVGIDVSVHQGDIDWQQVADSGIQFAMIRVGFRGYGTDGTLNADTSFETNIQGALDAGLQVGVYFFSQATTEAEVQEEAQFVLDAIKGYNVTMPVAFDWEHIDSETARTNGLSEDTLTNLAALFCSTVSQAGYQPMVYFYQNLAYVTYDLGQLTDNWFWLSEYTDVPDFYYSFRMWQYSNVGTVAGIDGNVDMDLYFSEN